jgi:hypothetical protein
MRKHIVGILIAVAAFLSGIVLTSILSYMPNAASNEDFEGIAIVDSVPLSAIPTNTIDKDSVIEQEIYGWYRRVNFSRLKDVDMIMLSRSTDFVSDGSEKIVSNAGVFTMFDEYGDQGFVEDAWAEVDEHHARFRTKKIKGFEFRFEGTFIKNRTMSANGELVLRGTLQQFRKGKKVAETTDDFTYYEPHCWH